MPTEAAHTAYITRDDLVRLLTAKDEAQAAFSASARACRDASEKGVSAIERVDLDLAQKATLNASCAADRAYAEALAAFSALTAEAA